MKPSIAPTALVNLVAELLRQAAIAWQVAPHGADHLIVFVTLNDGKQLVAKAGTEAHIDALVMEWLQDTDVRIPSLIARTEIEAGGIVFPVAVMSRVEGWLLAEAPRPPRDYLPSLIAQVQRVHQITTKAGAGPVTMDANRQKRSWKRYLVDILSGDDPEFVWESIARDPRVDRETLKRGLHAIAQHVRRLPEPEHCSLLHGDLNPYNPAYEVFTPKVLRIGSRQSNDRKANESAASLRREAAPLRDSCAVRHQAGDVRDDRCVPMPSPPKTRPAFQGTPSAGSR